MTAPDAEGELVELGKSDTTPSSCARSNSERAAPLAWVGKRYSAVSVSDPFHPGARSEPGVDSFLVDPGFARTNELEVGPGLRQ